MSGACCELMAKSLLMAAMVLAFIQVAVPAAAFGSWLKHSPARARSQPTAAPANPRAAEAAEADASRSKPIRTNSPAKFPHMVAQASPTEGPEQFTLFPMRSPMAESSSTMAAHVEPSHLSQAP